MTRWRPTVDQERWLALATRLRGHAGERAAAERAGGWRVTGPLARIALFALGVLAAGLSWGLLMQAGLGLVAAGIAALAAGEWLIRDRGLHASGVEEALVVTGLALIAAGVVGHASAWDWLAPLLALAALLAGLRLLNPLLTTAGAFVAIAWLSREPFALRVDATLGFGGFALLLAVAVAAAALAAGARPFRRPAHDRMLDWLVAALPVATYGYAGGWTVALQPELLEQAGFATTRVLVPVLLAAYAAVALLVGIRRRAHAPLLACLGSVACVLLELHRHTGLSAEAWLILCGAAALATGFALDRWLKAPRGGVTAARLTDREGPLDLLQLAGAAVLAQRGGPAAPPDDGFTPGGGRHGGGGASGTW